MPFLIDARIGGADGRRSSAPRRFRRFSIDPRRAAALGKSAAPSSRRNSRRSSPSFARSKSWSARMSSRRRRCRNGGTAMSADELCALSLSEVGDPHRRAGGLPRRGDGGGARPDRAPRPAPQRLRHRHRRGGPGRGACGGSGDRPGSAPRPAARRADLPEGPALHRWGADHRRLAHPGRLRA